MLALALAAPGAAPAKTLRDKKSGFSVTAPSGSKLKRSGSVYKIRRKSLRVTIAKVKTGQSAKSAGREIARALRGSSSRVKSSKKAWSALLTVRGTKQSLALRRRGKSLIIARAKRGAKGSRAAQTASDLALLRRLVASANGGRTLRLPGGIPLKRFVAPDGGSSALVPDLPGWNYGGGGGVIEGARANEGIFAFGVTFPVGVPGSGYPIEAPPSDAATALRTVIPRFLQRANISLQLQQVQLFPGSQQVLGPNMNSGFFAVRGVIGGVPADGVFLVGTFQADPSFWNVYYSFVAVRRGGDPRLGAALLDTWASWDPSANQAQRRNQTIATILSTTFSGGGPIDQEVFNEAAAKWSAYIRE